MHQRVTWAGAILALLIAVVLFSRFGIDDELRRDEAIYAYGGQQMAQGVPPYLSILDPKTPLARPSASGGPWAPMTSTPSASHSSSSPA